MTGVGNMSDPESGEDDLLDMTDMCRHLKVSRTTLHSMIRDGRCPAPFDLGKSKRWRWGRVRQWIRAVELIAEIKAGALGADHGDEGE